MLGPTVLYAVSMLPSIGARSLLRLSSILSPLVAHMSVCMMAARSNDMANRRGHIDGNSHASFAIFDRIHVLLSDQRAGR